MDATTVTSVTEATPTRAVNRRASSTRLKLAAVLVFVSVVAVAAAIPTRSWLVAALAGSLCALLGAIATRLTRTEVLVARREHARDRAEQAKAYRDISFLRGAEHKAHAARLSDQIHAREADIAALQDALVDAHRGVADAARGRAAAEAEAAVLADRVLELEVTVEALRAELDALRIEAQISAPTAWGRTA